MVLTDHISAFCRIGGHNACREHSIARCSCACHPPMRPEILPDALFVPARVPSSDGAQPNRPGAERPGAERPRAGERNGAVPRQVGGSGSPGPARNPAVGQSPAGQPKSARARGQAARRKRPSRPKPDA